MRAFSCITELLQSIEGVNNQFKSASNRSLCDREGGAVHKVAFLHSLIYL